MSTAGPELPPHLVAKRKRQAEQVENHEQHPPNPLPSRSSSVEGTDKRQRILGPSLPPAPLHELPQVGVSGQEEESSDDDEYGPALPPGPGQKIETNVQAAGLIASGTLKEQANKKLEHEEWMLVPPKQDDWSSKIDPTKLRNRKFNTGKGSKAPPQKPGGDNVLWTETPEQKKQRLEDEVLGIQKPATGGSQDKNAVRNEAEAEQTSKRIAEYNVKNRGRSLIEDHKKAVPKEKEDDPSKRAFDKEKDMGLGRKIGHAQKRELLNRASDFSSRFAGGSFL